MLNAAIFLIEKYHKGTIEDDIPSWLLSYQYTKGNGIYCEGDFSVVYQRVMQQSAY